MKIKHAGLCLLILFVMLLSNWNVSYAREEASLTLMIYMCGSNLESVHGAASADLNEMSAAKAGNDKVSVLVMVGGSSSWAAGYNPDETTILEMKNGRRRVVYKEEKRDMGDKTTLQFFLQYGKEHYPAEEYALILWDHGGGVLEGVCIDEQYSDDRLSYPEMKEAIEGADLGRKLSWIGFDACLMSSLELAVGLSPVADYMIASQETEPGYGWNYAFLSGLGTDVSSEETGRRIVDAYFEAREKSTDYLTLACIDLTKAAKAAEALSLFFSEVEEELNSESYPVFAATRGSTKNFGAGLRAVQEDSGYDLVDVVDLLLHTEGNLDQREAAMTAVQDAVVYHKATGEDTCGLTLYHPWENKEGYKEKWGETYQSLDLIDGYAKYVQSFGTLLNEEALVRWRNLFTQADGRDPDGSHLFSLQLTEEEASHVASAQLIITKQSGGKSEMSDSVVALGVVQANLTAENRLQAGYEERELYIQTEEGETFGPVSYIKTPDGKYNVVRARYVGQEEMYFGNLGNYLDVLYYFDAEDPSENPEVARIRVWDDVTHSYSSRTPFDPGQYRMMYFLDDNRIYPGEENGILPDYYEWEESTSWSVLSLSLPNEWHFVMRHEEPKNVQLFAMFRITDVQQNVYCSVPVPLENDYRYPFQITPDEINGNDYRITMKGYVDCSEEDRMILEIEAENLSNQDACFYIENVMLNHERDLGWYQIGNQIAAGETKEYRNGTPLKQLAAMEKVDTLTIEYVWETEDEIKSDQVSMHLEGIQLRNVRPAVSIGRAESEGVAIELYEIEQLNSGGLYFKALIQNNRESAIETADFALNGLQLDGNASAIIRPGKSRVVSYEWENGLFHDNGGLRWTELKYPYSYIVLINQWLSQRKEDTVKTFTALFSDKEESTAPIVLSGQLEIPQSISRIEQPGSDQVFIASGYPKESGEAPQLIPVLSESGLEISFRNLIMGEKAAVLVMQAENKADKPLRLMTDNYKMNRVLDPSGWDCFDIAPGCVKAIALEMNRELTNQAANDIQQLSFSCICSGEPARTVTIHLDEPAGACETGQIIWINSDQIRIESTVTESPAAGDITEDLYETYMDGAAGLSFRFPKTWRMEAGNSPTVFYDNAGEAAMLFSATEYASVDFQVRSNYGGWSKWVVSSVLGNDYREIREKPLDSKRNIYCFYERTEDDICETAMLFESRSVYLFQFVGYADTFEAYRPVFHMVLESIR